MRSHSKEILALGAILVFALAVRLALIDRPFHRDPEGCGSFYGMLARNYWRYDIAQTCGVPVMSMGVHDRPTYYPNHPPLVPLLIAGVLGVAGYTDYASHAFPPDWLIRLAVVPFTLGCIVMVWWLVRRVASARAAIVATALFAAMPMTLVFGGLLDVISPQLVFFVLLTIGAYLRFFDTPSLKWLALISAAFLPAALTDWPAFFLVPVLGLHFILSRRTRQWPWIIGFGVISMVFFMVPYAQVVLVTGDWMWMSELFRRRALSNLSDAQATFTFVDWITGALYGHAIVRHTWPVMILATVWMAWSIARWNDPVPARRVTWLVLGWAILHIAVGRQGVFVHEWWWWPLTPGVAMAGGLMVDQLCRWYELPRRGLIDFRPVYSAVVLVVVLLAFGSWTTYRALHELGRPKGIVPHDPGLDYTIVEIGEVIRGSAPPNAPVMLAESDDTLSLWYYADRPLRMNVWDPWTFERRLHDDSADLPFQLSEPLQQRPSAFVFPKAYRSSKTEPLFAYLLQRYPLRETRKFCVFDIRE